MEGGRLSAHSAWRSVALQFRVMRLFLEDVPGEHDCVVLGNIAVPPREFVDMATGVVVVGHEREGPARENVLADGFITPGVLDTSSVAVLGDVTVYIFHENIRCENAVHEVAS